MQEIVQIKGAPPPEKKVCEERNGLKEVTKRKALFSAVFFFFWEISDCITRREN